MLAVQKQQRYEILQNRGERTARRVANLARIERRFPWLRLAALLAGILAGYLAFSLLPALAAWLISAVAFSGFMVIVLLHRRIIERANRLETFHQMLTTHIARLQLNWDIIPAPGPVTVPRQHPFAADLDITGSRSLHQLLDTCVSLGGSQRLAAWLLQTVPDSQRITDRQALVRELLDRPAFCTRLELDGQTNTPNPNQRWDASALLHWLERQPLNSSHRPVLIILGLLALANITLFLFNALGQIPPLWIGTMVVYFALQSMKFRESSEVFGEAYHLARQLGQLRVILSDLENYPYTPGSRLAQLCIPFWQGPVRPSAALRKIGWIVSAASLRGNPFLSLALNTLVPWDLFFAYLLEGYKRELRGLLPNWLDAWYELEALVALVNFTRLNPENSFPEILEQGSNPVLRGNAIGHPLITDSARVTNDFTLQQLGEVIIITGSNMSGKSTFLRTLGINLVLAYAGSTVAARSLQTLPFRMFTSMNVSDSLSDGISFFYAEVSRLKNLLDQLETGHALPLFFLIDEIFRGTNNRERQIGSRAYTHALAGKNGVGLISTHDLELAHLAESIPAVRNYHFREDIHDGKMVFDYQIRPGASPTTNALRIMELAGLPIPRDATCTSEKSPK
jgi:ABC-type multidrug transport system fused ATPase/permease subunit